LIVDRIVIGGGFAGLLSSVRAAQRGEKVELIERSHRLGGALRSARVGGFDLDCGAEAFSTIDPSGVNLLEELGISSLLEIPRSNAPVILTESGKIPIPRGVLGIPADLREVYSSGAISKQSYSDALIRDSKPLPEDWHSLGIRTLVSKRLGQELFNQVVAPILTSVYGPHSINCSFAEIMPSFASAIRAEGSLVGAAAKLRGNSSSTGSAVGSLRGGLHTMVDFLVQKARSLGVQITTGADEISISKLSKAWCVESETDKLRTERLTIACGPVESEKLLSKLDGGETNSRGQKQRSTRIVLALVEDESLDEFPIGSGAIVSDQVDPAIRATSHINAKWQWVQDLLEPRQHLVRFSCSRPISGQNPTVESRISDALTLICGSRPEKILDIEMTSWPSHLVETYPGFQEKNKSLIKRGQKLGVDLAGSSVSGNGLLGIIQNINNWRES